MNDSVKFKGKDAKRIFLGIRKLRSVYSARVGDLNSEPLVSGSEISHSYFEVSSLEAAKK